MSDALEYAIKIIENYEMDIRAAIADGRLPAGYCQGAIFKDAIADIQKMSDAKFGLHVRKAVREGLLPSPEMQSIADGATEIQVLAAAAADEGWRVNRDTEEWFAEKPCWKAGHICSVDGYCDVSFHCYTHSELPHCSCCCSDKLFVRVGRKT